MTNLQLPRTISEARKLKSSLDTVLLNMSGITENVFNGLPLNEREFMESFLDKISISKNDRSKLHRVVEELKQDLEDMSVLELTLAFEPDKETIGMFYNWGRENIGKNILLSLKTDPEIVGGAIISYEGRYNDVSVAKKLEGALRPLIT